MRNAWRAGGKSEESQRALYPAVDACELVLACGPCDLVLWSKWNEHIVLDLLKGLVSHETLGGARINNQAVASGSMNGLEDTAWKLCSGG